MTEDTKLKIWGGACIAGFALALLFGILTPFRESNYQIGYGIAAGVCGLIGVVCLIVFWVKNKRQHDREQQGRA